jgi:hypothetical protein
MVCPLTVIQGAAGIAKTPGADWISGFEVRFRGQKNEIHSYKYPWRAPLLPHRAVYGDPASRKALHHQWLAPKRFFYFR